MTKSSTEAQEKMKKSREDSSNKSMKKCFEGIQNEIPVPGENPRRIHGKFLMEFWD